MQILHTSDWHLGRQFHGQSLEGDHAVILDQVYQALIAHKPHALIISGDIYDRASPPASAVRQFNDFIKRVASDTKAAIVMIAGNHDSGDRIESMSIMTDPTRALIRGPLITDELPLVLQDAHGPVAISALPFGYEFAARECFDSVEIDSPADVIRAQIAVAKAHVPDGTRWVVVAHAFVAGASPSDSERNLGRTVGGFEAVPANAFEGAHYVALGHLHRPQIVGKDHIRYSGSPLAFGFDESDTAKSMSLIDLAQDGSITLTELPFTPARQVRTLRGKLSDLVASGEPSDDFVKVVLTDEGRLIDPMKQVRGLYPNASALTYERYETSRESVTPDIVTAALTNPEDVISEFLTHVRGNAQTKAEAKIIDAQIKTLTEAEG
jgi:exonuclease SbcD